MSYDAVYLSKIWAQTKMTDRQEVVNIVRKLLFSAED